MTKEDFLIDTLEYYCENPSERRNKKQRGCPYSSVKATSEGCAIGRHLDKETAPKTR